MSAIVLFALICERGQEAGFKAQEGQWQRETYVVHQHALDTVLERHRARIARPARSAQLELNNSILEPAELDIATVLLNSRANPRLQQLLDHAHHLAIVLVVRQAILLVRLLCILLALPALHHVNDRLTGSNSLGDERKHLRADVGPVGVGRLGHGDEVGAVEDRGDAVNVHELRGQWRRVGRRNGAARVHVLDEGRLDRFRDDLGVGQELERVRVGRVLGLDEDGAALLGREARLRDP